MISLDFASNVTKTKNYITGKKKHLLIKMAGQK